MHTSVHGNICLAANLSEEQVPLKTSNTHFIIGSPNLFTTIIIVPLGEILDNIYQLLAHSPVCQSSI